jgi:spore coat protein CotH
MFTSAKGNPVTIKSPDEDAITPNQYEYIRQYFNKMENQWSTYLDLNTFLRHFLVGELSGNTDTYWSTYMYKDRGDALIYTGPVWDFDLAFENDNRTYPIMRLTDYIYRTKGSCAGNMRQFVNKIVVDDAAAKAQLKAIWGEVRQAGLTEESMTAYINGWEQTLGQSQELNFKRWPIMNEYVHQNPHLWGSYEAEVQNVRRYMKERIEWMDNKLGYVYEPAGIHTVAGAKEERRQVLYDLSGRPVSMSAPKAGLYISNGKKVVVK